MGLQQLGGLTATAFLKTYWQKKPLLIRQAFPGFVDLLTADELAGLAMEPDSSSRLVRERGGKRPWQVEHGPFAKAQLTTLPKADWSLLVSNVERWLPSAAALMDQFNFIPNWRADDLMVSFAPPGGSVGPHVDSYDVFLLQGQGRRRWGIAESYDPTIRARVDLKVLSRFKPSKEWVLEAGDMLYLPPGVAHYGVAEENCLTYSVGFRAPTRGDLCRDLLNLPFKVQEQQLEDRGDSAYEAHYTDPGLGLQAHSGELSAAAVANASAIIQKALASDDAMARWFGALVTRPDRPVERSLRRPSAARLAKILKDDVPLWRDGQVRCAFFAPPRADHLYLFLDGEEVALAAALRPLVELVTSRRHFSGSELAAALPRREGRGREDGLSLLLQLFGLGVIQRCS